MYLIDTSGRLFVWEWVLKVLSLKSILVFLCFIHLAYASKIPVKPQVIYDEDNRKEFYQVSEIKNFDANRSVLAVIYNENLTTLKNGEVIIQSKSLGQNMQLCTDEAFRDQLAASDCTGFLIAPNIVVTAGHCMNTVQDCKKKKFVQNYAVTNDHLITDSHRVYEENTASCIEILAREKNPITGVDYAVLKLDKDLFSTHYFKVRTEGKVQDNAILTVLGYPSGLPLKFTENSVVRSNFGEYFFQMDADTFGGNSGSPVVDPKTGVVEGILVRGETDYELDRVAKCYRAKKCRSGVCRGEDAVRTTMLPKAVLEALTQQ